MLLPTLDRTAPAHGSFGQHEPRRSVKAQRRIPVDRSFCIYGRFSCLAGCFHAGLTLGTAGDLRRYCQDGARVDLTAA
jgi:hypothetical protein